MRTLNPTNAKQLSHALFSQLNISLLIISYVPDCLYSLVHLLHTLLQNRPLFLAICPGSLWARDNRWLLSRVQRLAGPAGGTGAFCPGLRHQSGQNVSLLSRLVPPTGTKGPRSLLSRLEPPTVTKGPHFVPVGVSNRDKRPWASYPLPSPHARAIQLTYFIAVLGSG